MKKILVMVMLMTLALGSASAQTVDGLVDTYSTVNGV